MGDLAKSSCKAMDEGGLMIPVLSPHVNQRKIPLPTKGAFYETSYSTGLHGWIPAS